MTKKQNSIPFKLIDITTEQFADFEENYISEEEEFDIQLQTNINISSKQHVVGILTKFSFEQRNGLILVIECGCHFQLSDEYWDKQTENGALTLDNNLLTHFLVLAVGTCRGVLHAKKPKWIQNIMLPTWNVANLITEDVEINLNEEHFEEE